MNFIQIGKVISSVKEPVDQNWGNVTSEIHLNDNLVKGLKGLENFSHAIIIFFMHESSFEPSTDLIRHPGRQKNIPEAGIFAQRAKHRPNPIGITAVKITAVTDNILKVKGLDAISGTPVLDIKPYFPVFDNIENAVTPYWVEEFMKDYF